MFYTHFWCHKNILRRLDVVSFRITQKAESFARHFNEALAEDRLIRSCNFDGWRRLGCTLWRSRLYCVIPAAYLLCDCLIFPWPVSFDRRLRLLRFRFLHLRLCGRRSGFCSRLRWSLDVFAGCVLPILFFLSCPCFFRCFS